MSAGENRRRSTTQLHYKAAEQEAVADAHTARYLFFLLHAHRPLRQHPDVLQKTGLMRRRAGSQLALPVDMFCRPDPFDEKSRDDVAIYVVEDMLQHLSLDATISLLHKQIAKKAAEEPESGKAIYGVSKANSSKAKGIRNSDDASSTEYVQLVKLQKEYAALTKEYVKDTEIWKHRNGQLNAALDEAKRHLLKHSLAEGTSLVFPDTLARLPLLKEAVDQVHGAVTTCASRLLALADRHSLAVCNLEEYLHISNHHFNSASKIQGPLQASLLREVFFYDFESPSFGENIRNYQPFEKLQTRRQKRLQTFHKLRFLEVGHICMLQQQDAEFNGFVQTKSKLVESELRKLVKHADGAYDQHHICDSNHEHLINEFLADLWIDKLHKVSFLRLAKAVWQLHELALAFEPLSAEIFRVSPDSVYDQEYMQEAEQSMMQAKEWDKMGQYLSEKRVLFLYGPPWLYCGEFHHQVSSLFDTLISEL